MATNPYVNKVVFGETTVIDISPTTAVESDVAQGKIFFKASGAQAVGTLTEQAATTYHPSTIDQTITSGKYLTGAQTIKAVTTTNLTAANIASGVTVKIGDSTDDDCVASITGTLSGSSYTLLGTDEVEVNTTSTTAREVKSITVNISTIANVLNNIFYVDIFDNAGKRSGYFYGSVEIFMFTQNSTSSADGAGITTRYSTSFTARPCSATDGYGIFCSELAYSKNAKQLTATIKSKYSSTYSKTINGTYTINIYALAWPTSTIPFA